MTMTKFKLRVISLSMLFILLSFVFVQLAFADGGIVIYDPDMWRWQLQDMNQQLCAINYENGFENMLLSVDVTDLRGEKAVWIFPVPAEPDKAAIDIIKGFPRLWGYDLKKRTDENISTAFNVMRLSQVYTFPAFIFLVSLSGAKSRATQEEITVYEHIEKMGLTTELITAEDENAFHNYLINKGLSLPSDLKSILEDYIGENYSFVISWISDIKKFKEESMLKDRYGNIINTLGVSISFPVNKIYFPLKPTSVYGSQEIPILIYVTSHVTPELSPEIKKNSQINYFVQGYYNVPNELKSFFNDKTSIKDLEYTKIKLNSPSKYLTNDLWIKNSAPISVTLTDFANKSVLPLGLIFFVLSSCLASMFSGMVAFGKDEISKKKLALFGLWNFLTLIGFWIAANSLRVRKPSPELEQRLQSEGFKIYDRRRNSFTFFFTIFFLVLTGIFQIILQIIF